jgi:hypothetical protein
MFYIRVLVSIHDRVSVIREKLESSFSHVICVSREISLSLKAEAFGWRLKGD